MIRIALVSYFNTRPFLDGLNQHFGPDEVALDLLPPAACAAALREGRCAMALTPVGALPDFRGMTLMKDHCIGAEGAVDSVFLFSQVPVEETDRLVLDPHSRTSNGLARILYKQRWRRDPELVAPTTRSLELVEGRTAAVLIGDQAFQARDRFPYVYDLAAEWKHLTGLPFVFAVWVYRPEAVSPAMLARIRTALEWGRLHRADSARRWAAQDGYTPEEAQQYLTQSIRFEMDAPKHAAVERYFGWLSEFF